MVFLDKAAELVIPLRFLTLEGYTPRLLKAENLASLQGLLERSADYFFLISGSPPAESAAGSLLAEHPSGKSAADKFVVGIYDQAQIMVAVLDAVQDYPAPGAWWLGLLFIDPAYRDRVLGHKIYDWFEVWLIEQQVHGICLGVLEENHAAYRFWQAMGFEEYERQPAQQFSDRVHTVITMIKKF